MESFEHLATSLASLIKWAPVSSVLASAATLIGPSALMISGRAPRLGPGRALWVGLRTRLPILRPSIVQSQRADEAALLRNSILSLKPGQFQVVTGPKGVGEWQIREKLSSLSRLRHSTSGSFLTSLCAGKTTMVNTAVYGMYGVLSVPVAKGATSQEILTSTQRAVTQYAWTSLDSATGATRVNTWHKRIFGCPLLVILCVEEHRIGTPLAEYADVSAAARRLASLGYRVVIDASDNSLHPETRATLREVTMFVPEMAFNVLQTLPELQGLIAALREEDLEQVTWEILGGVPATYMSLLTDVDKVDGVGVAGVVGQRLADDLRKANDLVRTAEEAKPALEHLFSLFRTKDYVPVSYLKQNKIKESESAIHRVLRPTFLPDSRTTSALTPVSQTMRVVLRHRANDEAPSVEKVREVLRERARMASATPSGSKGKAGSTSSKGEPLK